jgi:methylenetetrahydrofolate dehydrogenase (NADP+)/methenyltetrahydrofolate cyclohydrolase
MILIDGKKSALKVHGSIRDTLTKTQFSRKPGLAFILIGEDPASFSYVKMKGKACEDVGIHSKKIFLPELVTLEHLLKTIHELNNDPTIDGILIQQPLPIHIPTYLVVEAIDPAKDVDGFHPLNLGKLIVQDDSGFIPCTPLGIVKLFEDYNISCENKHVVILGRSQIVGKPLSNLLCQKRPYCNGTVTLCHSGTPHLRDYTTKADILIVAIGKANFIKAADIKEGAVVIDVGINRTTSSGEAKITGDCDFDSVSSKAKAITPVPGGVGPMTIAMLCKNTLKSFLSKEASS